MGRKALSGNGGRLGRVRDPGASLPGADHVVGRVAVRVGVADLDAAMALRPRVETLAWRLMPAAIERVFDSLALGDVELCIDRLELDLGVVRPDHLEADTLQALDRALDAALRQAMAGARQAPTPGGRLVTARAAVLERFEAYLGSGVVGLVAATDRFDPYAELASLIDSQPGALAASLRRLAGDRRALERLVLQAGDEGMAALLRLLTPAEAAPILAVLDGIVVVNRQPPLSQIVGLEEPNLRRLMRVTTLEFLLRQPSGQFNQRMFLDFLLRREAVAARIDYADLLTLMAAALAHAQRRALTPSPFWTLLSALTAELSGPAANRPAEHGPQVEAGPDTTGTGETPAEIARLRRASSSPMALRTLVRRLDRSALDRLLGRLDPAGAMLARLRALDALHAASPRLALSAAAFARLTREIALEALLGSSATGSLQSRRLKRLLRRIARGRAGVRDDLAAGLPQALHASAALSASGDLPPLLADRGWTSNPAGEPTPLGEDDGRRDVRRHALELFFATGRPPDVGRTLAEALEQDAAGVAAIIRRRAEASPETIPALVARLLDWLTPQELIACLGPETADLTASVADGLDGNADAFWSPVFVHILQGETGEVRSRPKLQPDHASRELYAAGAASAASARLDRLALARHVLETGAAPWWAPQAATAASILRRLLPLSRAELASLLLASDPRETEARLWRAIDALGEADAARLLDRLAPWASAASGPLASILASAGPERRLEIGVRAAAAALAGAAVDLRGVTQPAPRPAVRSATTPEPSGQRAMDPRDTRDVAGLLAWLDGAAASAADAAAFTRLLTERLDRGDPDVSAYLAARRGDAAARRRWTRRLPEAALGRLLVRLAPPREARAYLDALMLVGAAWRQVAPFGSPKPDLGELWETLLDLVTRPGPVTLDRVVHGLILSLTPGEGAPRAKLTARLDRLARDGGYTGVVAVLNRRRRPPHRPEAPARRGAENDNVSKEQEAPVFIANAGLVLLTPYLPTLFERLGVLSRTPDETPRIEGLEALSRAVHLLQYLAEERLDAPEPSLALNKLLCGAPVGQPVMRRIEPVQAELDTCDGLLGAVIANWPIIRNTSPAGLRETFLQREGRLRRTADAWSLQVQRTSLDVLTDQVPWSFATVYHRWMRDPIHVSW